VNLFDGGALAAAPPTPLARPEEVAQRQAVLAEARGWIGTPFVDMGRVKGPKGGVDCLQLVYCVFRACGLTPELALEPYPIDFMMHSKIERALEILVGRAREVASPEPGDVVLWKMGHVFAHGAIVTAWPAIIHAWKPAGIVMTDTAMRPLLARRPRKFFSRWGVMELAGASPTLLAPAGLVGGGRREED
jgi:cell wall-associated NlpC family hydrolase